MGKRRRTPLQATTIMNTKNYAMFKKLKGNRDVKAVNKIIESINKVGYITNPILVNEKYEVIDGQNRLEAFEKLGIAVDYIIVRGIGIDEAISLNIGRTNWKVIDYIMCYAEQGIKSYQLLLKIINDYRNLKTQEIIGICTNRIVSTGWSMPSITGGNFSISDKEYQNVIEVVEYLDNLSKPLTDIVGARRTIFTAIAWIYRNTPVDKNRLAKIIETKYPLFKPVCDIKLFLQDVSEQYNKGIKNRLYFDVLYLESLHNNEVSEEED